jgi:hypothetical protein
MSSLYREGVQLPDAGLANRPIGVGLRLIGWPWVGCVAGQFGLDLILDGLDSSLAGWA